MPKSLSTRQTRWQFFIYFFVIYTSMYGFVITVQYTHLFLYSYYFFYLFCYFWNTSFLIFHYFFLLQKLTYFLSLTLWLHFLTKHNFFHIYFTYYTYFSRILFRYFLPNSNYVNWVLLELLGAERKCSNTAADVTKKHQRPLAKPLLCTTIHYATLC